MGLKQEMEVAMKLLEKDTHEKQDTLAALRLQLDQVKTLNLQMFQKAQVNAPPLRSNPSKRGHTSQQPVELHRTRNKRRRRKRRRLCSWSRG